MIAFNLNIDVDPVDGAITITGSRDSVLVLLEAARRDMNAMSQALGAGNELKHAYAVLAGQLRKATEGLPRVSLLTGVVSSAEEIARKALPDKASEPVRSTEEITEDDDILG